MRDSPTWRGMDGRGHQNRMAGCHRSLPIQTTPGLRAGAELFGICLSAGGQEAKGPLLEHQAREAAGPAGPGVDANAIGPDDRLGFDGMPMHDHPPEVAPGAQERLADPEQIVRRLPIEREARVYPRMDEQVIAALEAQLEPLQEVDVRARDLLAQPVLQLLIIGQFLLRGAEVDAVAVHRGFAAVA